MSLADVSRDGSLSEKEFAALARDYARRAVAALSIEVDGVTVGVKVEKVSWKAQGARTLDVAFTFHRDRGSTRQLGGDPDLEASTRWRACDLAVQTQDSWRIKSFSAARVGRDRMGFLEPWTMIPDQPLRVDLIEEQAAR